MEIIIYIFIFIWLIIITYFLYRIADHYQRLIGGVREGNLVELLDKILIEIKENKTHIEDIDKNQKIIKVEGVDHIQKIGILRFNPFKDTGGDQSFILSILDGHNDGIVLTSLHNRGATRWYAKNVLNGKGVDHELSEEEQRAIKKAELFRMKKSGIDNKKAKD